MDRNQRPDWTGTGGRITPEYAELAADPDKGVLIPGTGGVRKLRWAASGRGKSGGARVIYYWAKSRDVVLMLAAYAKNDQVDLTPAQRKLLRNLVEREFG